MRCYFLNRLRGDKPKGAPDAVPETFLNRLRGDKLLVCMNTKTVSFLNRLRGDKHIKIFSLVGKVLIRKGQGRIKDPLPELLSRCNLPETHPVQFPQQLELQL